MDVRYGGAAPVAFTISLSVIGALLLLRALRPRVRADLPPSAGVSVLDAARCLSGPNSPDYLLSLVRTVGPVFRLPVPQLEHFIVLADPALARALLLDPTTDKPRSTYRTFDALTMGIPNMVTKSHAGAAHGSWAMARKGVTPAFGTQHIARIRAACTEATLSRLAAHPIDAETDFDLNAFLLELSLSAICEAGFGYELSDEQVAACLANMRLCTEEAVVRAFIPGRILFVGITPSGRRAAEASAGLMDLASQMLRSYRALPPTEQAARGASLTALIAANPGYASDKERLADIVVTLFAAHDTTAYTLGWALCELAARPALQAELRAALVACGDAPESCKLLADIIREAMRLHPAVAGGILRVPTRDFTYEPREGKGMSGRKAVLPAGSTILLPLFAIQRDERTFERPDHFEPERWRRADAAAEMAAALMPFAVGKRNCVGQALAQADVQAVLALLCTRYDFEVTVPPAGESKVTRKPAGARLRARAV